MITKAIVEQIVDPYNIRVRIPLIDRTLQSSIHTSTNNLNIATVCTLAGCSPNIKVGDVVVVAIDETLDENVVILGHSYRNSPSSTYADLTLSELSVKNHCTLPEETTIGDISGTDLQKLSGINANVQDQLSNLLERIQTLEEKLAQISGDKQ